MSYIEDFRKLPSVFQAGIATVLVSMPFFYIIIIAYEKEILSTNVQFLTSSKGIYITCLCFVFSVSWWLVNFLTSLAFVQINKWHKGKAEKDDLTMFFLALSYLTIAILYKYYNTDVSLEYFLIGLFSIMPFRITVAFVGSYLAAFFGRCIILNIKKLQRKGRQYLTGKSHNKKPSPN